MWNIGIGAVEIATLALLALPIFFIAGPPRRWLVAFVLVAAIGIFVTPPDPVSAVFVAVPLAIAFACGVYFGPFVRQTHVVAH